MLDWLILGLAFAAIVTIVVVFLARSDRRLFAVAENRRPISDRIEDICEIAAFHIDQFSQGTGESDERPEMFWAPQVLEYYRQLESLSSNPDARPEDALELAAEASGYVEQHRLKGIFVADNAKQLADLIRMRDERIVRRA